MSETAKKVDESAPDVARFAGLRYVTGDEHEARGIRRIAHASGFRYVDSGGRAVTATEQLQRIRALAIPPAWRAVRIAPDEMAHIQVTGRDQRGRKQYRYHPNWRSTQDEKKFDRLSRFAARLPELRSRIDRDLALPGLPQEKVIASAVRLLLESHIRVGNEEYARNNRSYGLTTLRNRHVSIDGGRIELSFVGKSGKSHHIVVRDNRVARVLERCRRLSGALLFQFIDDAGEIRAIGSRAINDYLRAVCGSEFSAKDVRTWGGTVMAVRALCEESSHSENSRDAKRQLNAALRELRTISAIRWRSAANAMSIRAFFSCIWTMS